MGRNRWLVPGVVLALVPVAAVVSLCSGAVPVPLGELLAALVRGDTGETAGQILLLVRLPRVVGALLAGAALATAGTIIQGVLNNPMAAPNLIGVNAGAGLLVTLCCALAPTLTAVVPLAAFVGALLGTLLVLTLSQRAGAARITLVLAGIAISSIFSAGIDAVLTFVPEALNGYSDFRIGGLANLSLARVLPAAWVILPALVGTWALSGELDVLLLGGETAQSLGLSVKRLRLAFLVLASALAGAAVSFAGLLGFVGLLVPHMMRRLVGEESLPLLLASAGGGALLLTLCDLLARTVFAPYELPVGILLSLVGGPFFLWLLLGQRGGRSHG